MDYFQALNPTASSDCNEMLIFKINLARFFATVYSQTSFRLFWGGRVGILEVKSGSWSRKFYLKLRSAC